MSTELDAWRSLHKELEHDLKNRMDHVCNPALDVIQTAVVRGEIQYIRTLLSKVKGRARIT